MPAKIAMLMNKLQFCRCVCGEVDLMIDEVGLLVGVLFPKRGMWCSGHEAKEARVGACTQRDDLLFL